uniref:Uncharacterized protein n=1 Tax=Anopheles maculatus TaxID=74869 RepID=A0A182SLK8_9DIPT
MEKQSGRAKNSSSSTTFRESTTKKPLTAAIAAVGAEGGVTGVDSTVPETNTHPDSTSGDGGVSPDQLLEPGDPSQLGTTKSEDSLSIKSSDSVTTSGEYEIVPEAPSLGEDLVDGAGDHTPPSKQTGSEPIRSTAANGNPGGDIGADLAECIADDGEPGQSKEDEQETVKKRPAEGKKLTAISPILNIEGNGNMMDLEKNMNEVIHELEEDRTLSGASEPSSSNKATPVRSPEKCNTVNQSSQKQHRAGDGPGVASKKPQVPTTLRLGLQSMRANFTIGGGEGSTDTTPNALLSPEGIGRGVGQSVFYDCLDSSPLTEKKDDMKPVGGGAAAGETDEELSDIDQDCTIFSGVTYLGASRINAPKSEREILQKVAEMNGGGGGVGVVG